jgi:nucleotide-binding universal stress UspA family protein
MSTIHTIMAAVDLSRYAMPTAQYATQLARDNCKPTCCLSMLSTSGISMPCKASPPPMTAFRSIQFVNDRKKERHGRLKEMVAACHADPTRVRTIVRIGVPFQQLLAVIDEERPDLLIMATKGRSDMVDVVMGSCARSMYRRSPIPLLSIRGDKYFAA